MKVVATNTHTSSLGNINKQFDFNPSLDTKHQTPRGCCVLWSKGPAFLRSMGSERSHILYEMDAKFDQHGLGKFKPRYLLRSVLVSFISGELCITVIPTMGDWPCRPPKPRPVSPVFDFPWTSTIKPTRSALQHFVNTSTGRQFRLTPVLGNCLTNVSLLAQS